MNKKTLLSAIAKTLMSLFLFLMIPNIILEHSNMISVQGNVACAADEGNITSTDFMMDVNKLTPSDNKYSSGPTQNLNDILSKIAKFLLIAIPSLAVLFMVVGGIKIILAGGDSSKINNGKQIITYNIIAVVIALLSWSIIQLITWLIGSSA